MTVVRFDTIYFDGSSPDSNKIPTMPISRAKGYPIFKYAGTAV